MIVLGILLIVAGFILFGQREYIATFVCLAAGAVCLGKPRTRKTSSDEGEEDIPGELVQVDSPLRKVQAVSSSYRRFSFPVDGVNSLNDDGTDRQQILHALCGDEDMALVRVWLDDYLFGGKVFIRVMTDEGCVGQVRPKDVVTVRSFFEKTVRMFYLEVSRTETEENKTGYIADVVVIEDSPEQKKQED